MLPKSGSVELQYTSEEPLPVMIRDAIHPWMRGLVVIRSNPYFAKTDADGKFRIRNVPVGDHEFKIWHERVGYLKSVRFDNGATNDRGRLKLKIRDSGNELGVAKVPAKLFEHETSSRKSAGKKK